MKLWNLFPLDIKCDDDFHEDCKCKKSPWDMPYDKEHAFIVRARTRLAARKIAQENAGDEKTYGNVWLDNRLTACKELKIKGHAKVIMSVYRAGGL